jgi:hypothetical protein
VGNVGEVKAGVAKFRADTRRQMAEIRAVAASMDKTAELLGALAPDAPHGDLDDALARIEEIKRRLAEAVRITEAVAHETGQYAARI